MRTLSESPISAAGSLFAENLDQGEVALKVAPYLAHKLTSVLQMNGNLVGAIHHVIVRQDVAVAPNDDARTACDRLAGIGRHHLEPLAVARKALHTLSAAEGKHKTSTVAAILSEHDGGLVLCRL